MKYALSLRLDRRYVFRLQVGYINKNDRLRQVFQEVVNSFSFDIFNPSAPAVQRRINSNTLKIL